MHSHGNTMSFISSHKSTEVWSKSTPNSITIPCHLSRFDLFALEKYDKDFRQLQVMEFSLHYFITHTSFIKPLIGNCVIFQLTLHQAYKIKNVISCHNSTGGGLIEIHTKFHNYSMSFIQVLFVFHGGT